MNWKLGQEPGREQVSDQLNTCSETRDLKLHQKMASLNTGTGIRHGTKR